MKMNDNSIWGKYKVTEKEWFIVIVSTIKIWNIQWTFIFIYHFQEMELFHWFSGLRHEFMYY